MLILKQSTSIDIRVGPFSDVTDGATPETGITLGAADQAEVLKANGAATVTMAGAFVAITGSDGWYDYTVAAGDVDTVGEVVFVVQDLSVCLPVYVRGYVLEEAVYDAMYGAASAGPLQATTAGRTLDILATGEVPIDFDTSIGSLAAAQIEASALDGKGDWNVGKAGYSLTQSFPTNFADMSITVTAGLVDVTQTAADKVWSSATRTLTAFSTALAVSVWDVLASAVATASSIGLQLKTNVDAVLSNIEADTQNIQSRLPTTLVGGAMDADVSAMQAGVVTATAIATDAIDADALAADAVTKIRDAILPVQNVALDNIEFLFVAASDHVTPVTGATGTAVTRSIDGGAFGAGTGTLAEVANGIYQYDASAADMNGGKITFRFTGTGGTPGAPDDAFVTVVTGAGV